MNDAARNGRQLPPALQFLRSLWRLNHGLERRSVKMLNALGITAQQRMLIRCLGRFPDMAAGTLAELLHLDAGTLSAALRRLEERGLIRRHRDPADSRRVLVALTARGRRLDVPTAHTVEAAAEALLAETSAADVDRVMNTLTRFAELLEVDETSG